MSSSWCLQFYLFFTLSCLKIVETVPPEYCLSPLNSSDCNLPPMQVFSYYESGSRCELETWRGCPTLNLFANEYLCSIRCIFRMTLAEEEPDNGKLKIEQLKAEQPKVEQLKQRALEEINNILTKLIEEQNLMNLTEFFDEGAVSDDGGVSVVVI